MFSWIRQYVVEVCALPSALLVKICKERVTGVAKVEEWRIEEKMEMRLKRQGKGRATELLVAATHCDVPSDWYGAVIALLEGGWGH